MLIHNLPREERRAWCQLLVKPTVMAGQWDKLLGCLWQGESGQCHVSDIMSSKTAGKGHSGEI